MESKIKINDVVEFVIKAGKLNKYPVASANSIVSAIKTAEKGLTEEEPKTIDYFLSHLDELFGRQQDLALSQESINVYMTRIKRGVKDYQSFGTSPGAIYKWMPKERKIKAPKQKNFPVSPQAGESPDGGASNSFENNREVSGTKLNLLHWRIRPGVVIKIELPEDINEADVKKIKGYLDLELTV